MRHVRTKFERTLPPRVFSSKYSTTDPEREHLLDCAHWISYHALGYRTKSFCLRSKVPLVNVGGTDHDVRYICWQLWATLSVPTRAWQRWHPRWGGWGERSGPNFDQSLPHPLRFQQRSVSPLLETSSDMLNQGIKLLTHEHGKENTVLRGFRTF